MQRENKGQDAGGGLQTQPEQSPRRVHFHQQSSVVCVRRESIPEGEGDKSFIAQRPAINPVPVYFLCNHFKGTSTRVLSLPHRASPLGLQRSVQRSAVTFCVVRSLISDELKMCSVPFCLLYQHSDCLFLHLFFNMNFREIICLRGLCLPLHFTPISSDYCKLILNTSPCPTHRPAPPFPGLKNTVCIGSLKSEHTGHLVHQLIGSEEMAWGRGSDPFSQAPGPYSGVLLWVQSPLGSTASPPCSEVEGVLSKLLALLKLLCRLGMSQKTQR